VRVGLIENKMYFTVSYPLPSNCRISVRAPEAIFELMQVTLCGWIIQRADRHYRPMIDIVDDGKLRVISSSFSSARRHSDLVNTLNDAFIALAYCVRDLTPNSVLLHAAALSLNNQISIYFGRRKSGKSRYIAEKCIDRDICIADDLILYCDKSHLFQSLGFPVRLRRPIHASLLAKIDTSKILAGHSICYFTQSMCNMMPVGQVFRPDKLFQFQPQYKIHELPLAILDHHLGSYIIN